MNYHWGLYQNCPFQLIFETWEWTVQIHMDSHWMPVNVLTVPWLLATPFTCQWLLTNYKWLIMKVIFLGIGDWTLLPLIESSCIGLPVWLSEFVTYLPGWKRQRHEAEGLLQCLWRTKGICCFMLSFMAVPQLSQESKWTRNSLAYRWRCSWCMLDFIQSQE